MIEIQLRDRAN